MLPITAGTCWSACTRRVAPSTSPRRILHAFSSSAVDASSRPRISSVGPPSRWVTATPEFRRHQSTSTAAAVQSSRSRSRLLPFAAVTAIVAAGAAWYLLPPSPKLSPDRFTPLKIISVTPLTPETALFKLALPKSLLDAEYGGARAIQSLYVMQPDLQIQRAYTPLSAAPFRKDGCEEVDLVVKRYPNGEASRYMHRLGPGDDLRVRGPVTTWDCPPEQFDEVVFIVGGTGITPAYQFIEQTLASSPSALRPRISVIYSSPTPSRILLKSALDAFAAQDPTNISINYLVDGADAGEKLAGETLGLVNVKGLRGWIGSGDGTEKRRMVVVCGPEMMVNAVAGPRARDLSQGPVGGMLGELKYSSSQVVKL